MITPLRKLSKLQNSIRNRFHRKLNTYPEDYVINLSWLVADGAPTSENSSKQIVRLLGAEDSRVKDRRFQEVVLDAIFADALEELYYSHEKSLLAFSKLKKRYGTKKAKTAMVKSCDVLRIWKYENSKFVPDAFLIDAEQRTIVCYEIEDTNSLKKSKLEDYAEAWNLMDYIAWDLHLIAYDIFGNPKIINLSAKAYFSILQNARNWK